MLEQIGFSTKIFHPNVDPDQGKICIGALKETEWKPTTRIVDSMCWIIYFIILLRSDPPQ